LFDITPYAGAFVRYFVRHDICQLLPRKFKVAFTATDEDVAVTLIHDLGFLPRVRDGVKGVEIRTGGGTSIMARVGSTLFDYDEEANAPAAPVSAGSPNGDHREFDRFVEANVKPQRQDGFSTVEVKVTRGDLAPEQFRGIAQVMRDFTGGYARTSIQQNLV